METYFGGLGFRTTLETNVAPAWHVALPLKIEVPNTVDRKF